MAGTRRRAAESTIRAHDVLLLTPQESRQFVEALLGAQTPNAALRAAAAHYRRVMASGDADDDLIQLADRRMGKHQHA
jgi:uncharacterized protein (DUF1778 family)